MEGVHRVSDLANTHNLTLEGQYQDATVNLDDLGTTQSHGESWGELFYRSERNTNVKDTSQITMNEDGGVCDVNNDSVESPSEHRVDLNPATDDEENRLVSGAVVYGNNLETFDEADHSDTDVTAKATYSYCPTKSNGVVNPDNLPSPCCDDHIESGIDMFSERTQGFLKEILEDAEQAEHGPDNMNLRPLKKLEWKDSELSICTDSNVESCVLESPDADGYVENITPADGDVERHSSRASNITRLHLISNSVEDTLISELMYDHYGHIDTRDDELEYNIGEDCLNANDDSFVVCVEEGERDSVDDCCDSQHSSETEGFVTESGDEGSGSSEKGPTALLRPGSADEEDPCKHARACLNRTSIEPMLTPLARYRFDSGTFGHVYRDQTGLEADKDEDDSAVINGKWPVSIKGTTSDCSSRDKTSALSRGEQDFSSEWADDEQIIPAYKHLPGPVSAVDPLRPRSCSTEGGRIDKASSSVNAASSDIVHSDNQLNIRDQRTGSTPDDETDTLLEPVISYTHVTPEHHYHCQQIIPDNADPEPDTDISLDEFYSNDRDIEHFLQGEECVESVLSPRSESVLAQECRMMDAGLALGSEAAIIEQPLHSSHSSWEPAALPPYLANGTPTHRDLDTESVHSDNSQRSIGERQRTSITEMYKETIERLRIDGEFKPIGGIPSGSRRSVNSSELELSSFLSGGSRGNLNSSQDLLESALKSTGYRHGSADQLHQAGTSSSIERCKSAERILDYKKEVLSTSNGNTYSNGYTCVDHEKTTSKEYNLEESAYKSGHSSAAYSSSAGQHTMNGIGLQRDSSKDKAGGYGLPSNHGTHGTSSATSSGHGTYSPNSVSNTHIAPNHYHHLQQHPQQAWENPEYPQHVSPAIKSALVTSRTAPLTFSATSNSSRAHGPLAPSNKELYRVQDLEDNVSSLKRLLHGREQEIDELKAHQRGLQAELHQLRSMGKSSPLSTSEGNQTSQNESQAQTESIVRERETLRTEVQQLKQALEQARTGPSPLAGPLGIKSATPPIDDYSPNNPMVLQRKISELEGQLADAQEASETAALRLSEAEKEISRVREETQRGATSLSASALQRENTRLREMLSVGGQGPTSPDGTAYLMSEVSQLREDLRLLRDRNHQLTQDNIQLTEFIRDIENKPRDGTASRHTSRSASPQLPRSRSFELGTRSGEDSSHRLTANGSANNHDHSYEIMGSTERISRLNYETEASVKSRPLHSSSLNGDSRSHYERSSSSERYSSYSRGKTEPLEVNIPNLSKSSTRPYSTDRVTNVLHSSGSGDGDKFLLPSYSKSQAYVDDLIDEPKFTSTLRNSTLHSKPPRATKPSPKMTPTNKMDDKTYSEFRNWDSVEKYKNPKLTEQNGLDLPDPSGERTRRDSGGSDSTGSLLNELNQQLSLQMPPLASDAGATSRRQDSAYSIGSKVTLELSPPVSPPPENSGYSRMGRPLEPKPLATQHNKHLLDNGSSSPSVFNTNGRIPYAPRNSSDVTVGDIVKFCRQGGKISRGLVKYCGHLPGKNDSYLGVELELDMGKHDGMYEGQRYFTCPPNRGVFVAFSKVVMVWKQ